MKLWKESKDFSQEKIMSIFTLDECKESVNVLESLIEYLKSIEKVLQKIIKENNDLKNKLQESNDSFFLDFERKNESFHKLQSQGKEHIVQIDKIINNFRQMINKQISSCNDNGKIDMVKDSENIDDISEESKDIIKYYEGKIGLMEKKMQISENLENLYIKKILELKMKQNKNDIKRFVDVKI